MKPNSLLKIQVPRAVLTLLIMGGMATGCAHGDRDRTLDAKLAAEPPVSGSADLRNESTQAIEGSESLTPQQKTQVLAIRDKVFSQTKGLQDQSLKLRELLVRDLMQENYNAEEVALIKSRLKKNEEQRLAVIFNGIDEANLILGHFSETNRQFLDDMLVPRGHGV